jgi:hypothetical protein
LIRNHPEKAKFIFLILALVFLLPWSVFAQGSQKPLQAKPGDPIDWPREIQDPRGKLMIYQPQVDDWKDYKTLVARSAIAFAPKGSEENPQLGILEFSSETEVDYQTRLVKVTNFTITGGNFPSLDKQKSDNFLEELKKIIKPDELNISLDRIIASMQRSGNMKNVDVKNDPPPILVGQKPSILVIFDGAPLFSAIKENDLKFAVNTNWDIFQDEANKTYYLRDDASWLQTGDLKGVWGPADKLPKGLSTLPKDDNWKDVAANLPGKKLAPQSLPHVFISEIPAELIVLDGEPKYQPIPETNLTWVTNTESDLFMNPADKSYYYLVSGRWFRATDLKGPWTFATPNLPEDFKKIPASHERGDVRASVPGTREAEESVIQASIPQTAKVSKKEVKAPEIVYAGGKPEFKPIKDTSLSYAANTSNDVIQFKETYYLCYEGVWFSAMSPTGPWSVTENIPAEISKIPPDSPMYHNTYVTIVQDDNKNDDWVTFALYAGYFGTMIASDCVVWGTGWYYPPYIWHGPYYPMYYPYSYSYGVGAFYNSYTGTFGRFGGAYGPYGGVGFGTAYNPVTGTYARGARAYGPYGSRGFAEAYNPRTGTGARTRQGSNYYSSWGSTAVRRGDDWVRSAHYNNSENGMMKYRTSDGNRGFVGHKGDDLYAGRDGNVYKRTDDGWSEMNKGNWNKTNKPDQLNQLNKDRTNRDWSTQKTRNYNNWNRGGGNRASRGGGGGFRRR